MLYWLWGQHHLGLGSAVGRCFWVALRYKCPHQAAESFSEQGRLRGGEEGQQEDQAQEGNEDGGRRWVHHHCSAVLSSAVNGGQKSWGPQGSLPLSCYSCHFHIESTRQFEKSTQSQGNLKLWLYKSDDPYCTLLGSKMIFILLTSYTDSLK